jgi:hypothetical protein
MVPAFSIWVGNVRRYGRQLRDYLETVWGMCQCRGACFLMWVGTVRGYGKQLREYVVNMREMCQHHGACFFDLGGKCS